jgi:hypothetical protein
MHLIIAQAAEAATIFQGIPGAPNWLNSLLVVVVPVISFFVVQYLRARQAEVAARLQNENLSRKERLELRLRNFLMLQTETFVEKDLFEIAAKIKKDKSGTSVEAIAKKTHAAFKMAHEKLLTSAENYFSAEDIDISAELGKDVVEKTIRWAADKTSPFPGKPTVSALLAGGAEMLLSKGVVWTKARVASTGAVFNPDAQEDTSA